jgi:hypothetical protein
MPSDFDLIAILAGLASASGHRTPEGAVAHARAILDTMRTAEPELYEQRQRRLWIEAQRRAAEVRRAG